MRKAKKSIKIKSSSGSKQISFNGLDKKSRERVDQIKKLEHKRELLDQEVIKIRKKIKENPNQRYTGSLKKYLKSITGKRNSLKMRISRSLSTISQKASKQKTILYDKKGDVISTKETSRIKNFDAKKAYSFDYVVKVWLSPDAMESIDYNLDSKSKTQFLFVPINHSFFEIYRELELFSEDDVKIYSAYKTDIWG